MESPPPGFGFNPSEEELINYYLRHKILGNDDKVSRIAEVGNICNYEPWELPKLAATFSTDTLYFFSRPDRKYRKSGNNNRLTRAGYWKVTGKKREIKSRDNNQVVGIKTILVFHRGRAHDAVRTNWIIHEYQPNPCCSNGRDYVISRLHQKASKMTVDSAVDADHNLVSKVENPVTDITFPEGVTLPTAQQPELCCGQDPSDVYLQHTNGVTDDNTRSMPQLGFVYEQENNKEAAKLDPGIQYDQNSSGSMHATLDDSRPSESLVSLHTGDLCLPEMHMMQGLNTSESSGSRHTEDIEAFYALVDSILEVAPGGRSHLVLKRLFERASAYFS